ncbi:hypothetical protein QUB47_07765 [Microcoleus sp. AT9_B5]
MAAIFPMADFSPVTAKKTMAASRKNTARGLGGDTQIPSLGLVTVFINGINPNLREN